MRRSSPAPTGRFSVQTASLGCRLATLAGANAASVAALYLGQVLTKAIANDFPRDAVSLSLIPGATLAGYAVGVSAIAFGSASKGGLSVTAHIGLQVLALCAAGLAPSAPVLVIASFAIGAGSAVAQRLLAAAGGLGGAMHSGAFIGKTICAALTAVLGTRLTGEFFAQLVGWRTIFFLVATGTAIFGILNYWLNAAGAPARPVSITTPTTTLGLVVPLWQQSALLRWAVFQHGAVFTAYNLAWMTILFEVPAQERAAVVVGGGGVGVITALLAGYCVDRFARHDLARCGAAAVAVATALLLPAAYSSVSGLERALLLLPGMALLDGGLQLALVANQARVQALLPDIRPRLAALLTVCGSLGGAVGAGLGYWLWQRFGWQAAIGLAGVSGLVGFGCATLAGSKQRNDHAAPAGHGLTDNAAVLNPAVPCGLCRLASSMPLRSEIRKA